MNLYPFLCLGGNEVANAQRTLAYLLRGLGDRRVEVAFNNTGATLPERLSCYCASLDDDSGYVSPAADAPWYVPSVPASGRFLGLTLDTLTLTPSPVRSVSPRVAGGANVGSLHRRQRVLQARGFMHATDGPAMDWGERWLTEVLTGGMCDPCDRDVAEILPACPTDADLAIEQPPSPFRFLRQVGLVDGPHFTPVQGVPGCVMEEVAFQLTAGDPYRYHATVQNLTNSVLNGAGISSRSSIKSTNEWGGELAIRLDIEATSPLSTVVISATPISDDGICPDGSSNPCALYELGALDAGNVFTIDAIEGNVSELDITSKVRRPGFGSLNFDGEFSWIVVPPCSRMCITVDVVGGGTALLSIASALREL